MSSGRKILRARRTAGLKGAVSQPTNPNAMNAYSLIERKLRSSTKRTVTPSSEENENDSEKENNEPKKVKRYDTRGIGLLSQFSSLAHSSKDEVTDLPSPTASSQRLRKDKDEVETEETRASSRTFSPRHLSEAVKILRGDSTASTNCIQLTVNIMNYLRTGIPPTEEAATISGTSTHVRLFPHVNGAGHVTAFGVQNGTVALSQHSGPRQGICCAQEKIRETLKNEANHFGVPIYGFVILVSANEKASHDGHVIPFYATPNKGEWAPYQICFIDGHNISNHEYLAEPVLPNLRNGGYEFVNFNSRRELKSIIQETAEEHGIPEQYVNVFHNNCFYFIEGPASVRVFEPHTTADQKRSSSPSARFRQE
jgi:hypothetical protein